MHFLKELFFWCVPNRRLPQDRAVILMYHSVSEREDYFSSVSPEAFALQMAYLSEEGYPVITLAELVRRLRAHEPLGGSVVITFDDGYRDNATDAFPILESCGFPATIFVTTDLIGGSDKRGLDRMTQDDLALLASSGLVAIEPHTRTHPKLAALPEDAARAEVAGSKEVLEGMLSTACRLFAYPYGSYAPATVSLMAECGFDGAVTVNEGTVHAGSLPFELPRVSVDRSTTAAQFKGKLSTAIDTYERLKVWR